MWERGRRTELATLVRTLARGVVDAEQLTEVTAALLDVVGGCAMSISSTVGFESWHHSSHVSDAWSRFHVEHRHEDPGRYRLLAVPPGTWYLVKHDSTEMEKAIDLFHGLPRHGLGDLAAARLYSPFADDLFVAIYREKGEPAFDDDDRVIFDLLYPHLAGALATKCALAIVGAPEQVTGKMAPPVHVHVAFPGRRVEWTPSARALFEDVLGPIRSQGWRRVEKMLQRCALRFSSANIGGRSQRIVGDIRAELANVPPVGGEARRFLVLLHRDRQGAEPTSSPSEELLAPVERNVARAAARGLSAKEIAVECKITHETARWYLKSVYEKLRVENRAELALLLGLGLPR